MEWLTGSDFEPENIVHRIQGSVTRSSLLVRITKTNTDKQQLLSFFIIIWKHHKKTSNTWVIQSGEQYSPTQFCCKEEWHQAPGNSLLLCDVRIEADQLRGSENNLEVRDRAVPIFSRKWNSCQNSSVRKFRSIIYSTSFHDQSEFPGQSSTQIALVIPSDTGMIASVNWIRTRTAGHVHT